MPRIPVYTAQQELNPGAAPNVNLSMADFEAKAKQGAALAGLGSQLSSSGERIASQIAKRQDEAARFTDGVYDDARRNELTAYLEDARQKMPETGQGFHDSVMPKFDEIAEKRFSSMAGPDAAKYREKWQAERIGWSTKAATIERDTGSSYAGRQIDQAVQQGAVEITSNPGATDAVRERVAERIKTAPYWTDAQKADALTRWEKTALTTEALQKFKADPIQASRELGVPLKSAALPKDAPGAITAAAKELGISPVDLATVISYETGGTFDPSIRGGAGRRHIGLIQFGIPEQQKYGARQDQSFSEQMQSVVGYLKDRGLKPGMSLLDLYSTINAGAPGLSHRSDAGNGGAPGTVKDKVEKQMGGHRAKAMALLGDASAASEVSDGGLPANKRYAALDATTREQIVSGANREAKSSEAEAVKTQATVDANKLNTLQVSILDGQSGMAEIKKAREEGWLTDAGDISKVMAAVEKKEREVEDVTAYHRNAATPDFVWNPFDKAHKAQVEAGYTAGGGTMQALQTVVQRTGIMPDSAATTLRGALVSNNVSRVESAMQAMSSVRQRSPNILESVTGSKELTDATVEFEHDVTSLGFTAQEAARRYTERRSPEYQRETAKIKTEDIDKEVKSLGDADIRKAFNVGLPIMGRPDVEFSPESRARAMGDYAELYREYRGKTNDASMAKAQALAQLGRTWGQTTISGKPTVIKFPPERSPVYAGIEEPGAGMAAQAILAIKAEANVDVKAKDLRLREVINRDGAGFTTATTFLNNVPPRYLLEYTDKDGVTHTVQKPFWFDPEPMRRAQTEKREAEMQARRAVVAPLQVQRDESRVGPRRLADEARQRIEETRRSVEGAQ